MNRNLRWLFLILMFLLLGNSNILAQVKKFTIQSPDKRIAATIFINNGWLQYEVTYKNQRVIEHSRMGVNVNGIEYGCCNNLFPSKVTVIKKSFPWRGIHSVAHHYSSAATVKISSSEKEHDLTIAMQVFNNGLAFRYLISNKGAGIINNELTTFTIPAASNTWWQGDVNNYEGEYIKCKPAAISKGQPIGLPITIQLPNNLGYAALAEADINNFAGMHLVAGGGSSFRTALASKVKLSGDIITPWRVISIGQDLNTLVNNDIIASLSAKPDPAIFPHGFNTEWIRPGKSVWSWMTAKRAVTPENMRRFSDLAAQCGIPYNLVDDGWGKWREEGKDEWQMLKELVDYSAKKKVRIWVWAAYPDNNGIPGLKDSVYMLSFFKRCKQAGVAGIKIDFMSSESQDMMTFYNRASLEAARQQLMVNFHGASKPSGQSKRWPNELTREAVRGLEYSEDTDWPTHNTIIPFTRFLAGPGDYTPISTAKFVSSTTLAHQVATAVTFTSPFLCLGVEPQDLLKSKALPFVRMMPTIWDETIVLPASAIGELSVMARRSGDKWFLAILNNKQSKKVSIPLSFLTNKSYLCQLLGSEMVVNRYNGKKLNAKVNLEVELSSGDGMLAVFSK